MKVCFSGTFNILHKGHRHLIDKAFKIAGDNGTVYIGITKGEILKKKKFTKPLAVRIDALKDYLSSKGYDKRTVIQEIFDEYGPAIAKFEIYSLGFSTNFDIILFSSTTTIP